MALERRKNAENQQRQMQLQTQQMLRRGLRRDEGTFAYLLILTERSSESYSSAAVFVCSGISSGY